VNFDVVFDAASARLAKVTAPAEARRHLHEHGGKHVGGGADRRRQPARAAARQHTRRRARGVGRARHRSRTYTISCEGRYRRRERAARRSCCRYPRATQKQLGLPTGSPRRRSPIPCAGS
jgi:hypothetical protein